MSRNIPLSVIQRLQNNPDHVRNICILAHVDHGKTTLADGLISSNGIISTRMAGEVRYMDSLEEEQSRGITMKSSSISLYFEDDQVVQNESTGEKSKKRVPYLINLVDSPGHIDFSSDVSAAVRLCDGCLVVVDAIEGVCTQTITVLQQAYQEGVKPILIINKIDRLCVHLKQSPMDAYYHIRNIIEKVNATISSLYTADVISNTSTTSFVIDSEKEEQLLVSPTNNTVLFASALHGWCFSLRQFAELYAPVLGINKAKLVKYMWGDYVYNAKNKTVSAWTSSSKEPPIFVKMVLSLLWRVYKSVYKRNEEVLRSLLETIHVSLTPREFQIADEGVLIKTIMERWLPLYRSVLKTVVKVLPSPNHAQKERYSAIWEEKTQKEIAESSEKEEKKDETKGESSEINGNEESQAQGELSVESTSDTHTQIQKLQTFKSSFDACTNDGPLMIYICKLFVMRGVDIQSSTRKFDAENEYEIALCRSFSGRITSKSTLYVIPSTDDANNDQLKPITTPIQLFLLMGREIVAVDEVPAGNIFGIWGLEGSIIKMGTISDTPFCPSLSSLRLASDPIVQIAVETEKPNDMPQLVKQLRILNTNDNSVRVSQSKTGEYIVSAVGELQLEVIISDLRKRLSHLNLVVSPPIINIRESCALLPALEEGKECRIPPSAVCCNRMFMKMRVLPLTEPICDLLYNQSRSQQAYQCITLNQEPSGEVRKFLEELEKEFNASPLLKPFFNHIVAFGPKPIDTNILAIDPAIDCGDAFVFGGQFKSYFSTFIQDSNNESPTPNASPANLESLTGREVTQALLRHFHTSLINGFKIACEAGPLCNEPLWGVLFILEDLFFIPDEEETTSTNDLPEEIDENKKIDRVDEKVVVEEEAIIHQIDVMHTLTFPASKVENEARKVNTGSCITLTRQLCHQAFQKASARIAEPMYRCVLQCSSEHLGKLYSVINQRRGEVLNEDIWEGTDIFTVTCSLPVTESLGLANNLREQTSGAVNQPQLQFSHWQVLDEDPFSKPITEDEIEEWGDSFATRNRAKQIIDSIRRRKGMQTDEKIVENAEKQRTLKSKWSVCSINGKKQFLHGSH